MLYFRFPIANRVTGYLNVLVMPTSGNAELFVRRVWGKDAPTASSYDLKWKNWVPNVFTFH